MADDDESLLQLSADLLSPQAEVDCVSATAQALRWILERDYDLLITDLNIEHASDGLMLAAAMRVVHPRARNVLITGYPDFTGAITAFQGALDEVLIKPVDVKALMKLPQQQVPAPAIPAGTGRMTVWTLVGRERNAIVAAWLKLVEADPLLSSITMTPEERLDHMTELLDGLCEASARPEKERASAERHGYERRRLGYNPEWISIEMSYLRRVIFGTAISGLLGLDLSRFPQDLFTLNLRLDADMLDSLRAFGLAPR